MFDFANGIDFLCKGMFQSLFTGKRKQNCFDKICKKEVLRVKAVIESE